MAQGIPQHKRRYVAIVKFDPPQGVNVYSGFQVYAYNSPHEIPRNYVTVEDIHRDSLHWDSDWTNPEKVDVTCALRLALAWIEKYNLGSDESDHLLYILNLPAHMTKQQLDRIRCYVKKKFEKDMPF